MSDIDVQPAPAQIVVHSRGPRGFPGPAIELRNNDGVLEWRVEKAMPDPWEPLIDLGQFLEDSDAAADLARSWASQDEDVVVDDGLFSALHHAAKALASATAASASAATATTQAGLASDAADAASASAATATTQAGLASDAADAASASAAEAATFDPDNFYTKTEADGLLADKADDSDLTAHVDATNNPHAVTKSQVGLGNADNTSDADKPVSTATQSALDGKQAVLGFTPEDSANKGVANGYAALDSGGLVPPSQLPPLGAAIAWSSKSGAYTAVSGDQGSGLACNGTFTVSLDPAATLGNGWFVYIRNAGTGRILIDPDGSETIDGRTGIYVYPGETFMISCDGSLFVTQGRAKIVTLSEVTVSSPVASVEFEAGADDTEFDAFELIAGNVSHDDTVSNRQITLQIKDGGSYVSGSNTYGVEGVTATAIILNASAASHTLPFDMHFVFANLGAAFRTTFRGVGTIAGTAADGRSGARASAAAYEGVRVIPNSGNIDSGTFIYKGHRG